MDLLSYLEDQRGWVCKRAGSSRGFPVYMGHCFLHNERTPSCCVYTTPGDEHYYCQGCRQSGDLVKAVQHFEFPQEDFSQRPSKAVFDWVRQHGGNVPDAPQRHRTSPPPRRLPIYPTKEESQFLSIIFGWWQSQLFDPAVVRRKKGSQVAQVYLTQTRGVDLVFARESQCVGYAPEDTGSFLDMCEYLKARVGDTWREIAITMGILNEQGGTRLRNRIMLLCCTKEGTPVFYTGRFAGSVHPVPYLNMPTVEKHIFCPSYPQEGVEEKERGTDVVENAFASLLLSQAGYTSFAVLGNGIHPPLSHFHAPFILAHDHDRSGSGDIQAAHLADLCDRNGKLHYRLKPPKPGWAVDDWILSEGREAYQQARQRLLQS